MNFNIRGRILNRNEINILIKNSQGDLRKSIELTFHNGLKLKYVLLKVKTQRRTLQYRLSVLGKKLFGINVTYEMIRWSSIFDFFIRGYTADYISDFFGYSKNSDFISMKRNTIGAISNKLRLKVFKRDNFKCVFCSSEEKLCIDHIIPFSKGGKTNLINLQTLCFKCNSGKKDKIVFKDKQNTIEQQGEKFIKV